MKTTHFYGTLEMVNFVYTCKVQVDEINKFYMEQ